MLLEVFHFKKCSASRWCSVGVSCRVLLASLSLGLGELMQIIMSKESTSEYYTHNWTLLTQEMLEFVTIAAMASFGPDSILYELMEDDRLARRAAELQDTLACEVNWLCALPHFVWRRLQLLIGPECRGAHPSQ